MGSGAATAAKGTAEEEATVGACHTIGVLVGLAAAPAVKRVEELGVAGAHAPSSPRIMAAGVSGWVAAEWGAGSTGT